MIKLGATIVRRLNLIEALIDVIKDDISFEDLERTLPFATIRAEGETKTHIVSGYAFSVPLYNQERTVEEGETLCGKRGDLYLAVNGLPACPGCHAIGQGIVARELMKSFPAEYFEQKRAAK